MTDAGTEYLAGYTHGIDAATEAVGVLLAAEQRWAYSEATQGLHVALVTLKGMR